MENSREIDVTALDATHRRAFEDIIGTPLQQNQRLIISVTETGATSGAVPSRQTQSISDWARVYEGLTDEEVEGIDREVRNRANLTRPLP